MRGLIYGCVFLGGALLGNLVPGYIDLHEQRLQARFQQVSIDLAPFQEIADRYHDGSMTALVQYHLASSDPTFHDEGVAIGGMLNSHVELREALAAMDGTLLDSTIYLVRTADTDVARQTRAAYRPSLVLTRDSALLSIVSGAALVLTVWAIWLLLRLGFHRTDRRA
jgi:hypothetical protein